MSNLVRINLNQNISLLRRIAKHGPIVVISDNPQPYSIETKLIAKQSLEALAQRIESEVSGH